MALTLLSAAASTGASSAVIRPLAAGYRTTSLWQISITGVATVAIEGRLSSSAPYTTITTATASMVAETVTMPDMRIEVLSLSSGTVSAWTV